MKNRICISVQRLVSFHFALSIMRVHVIGTENWIKMNQNLHQRKRDSIDQESKVFEEWDKKNLQLADHLLIVYWFNKQSSYSYAAGKRFKCHDTLNIGYLSSENGIEDN